MIFCIPERTLPDVLIGDLSNQDYYSPLTYVSYLGTVEHEGCTLAYGNVLDDNNEFVSLPNLYAVGPCTFPRMGAANPGLTSLALVRRLASILSRH